MVARFFVYSIAIFIPKNFFPEQEWANCLAGWRHLEFIVFEGRTSVIFIT